MKNLKQYILEKILINKDTTYNVEYEKVEEVDNFDDFIGYLNYNKYTYENDEEHKDFEKNNDKTHLVIVQSKKYSNCYTKFSFFNDYNFFVIIIVNDKEVYETSTHDLNSWDEEKMEYWLNGENLLQHRLKHCESLRKKAYKNNNYLDQSKYGKLVTKYKDIIKQLK